jgi:hypothetical protein
MHRGNINVPNIDSQLLQALGAENQIGGQKTNAKSI